MQCLFAMTAAALAFDPLNLFCSVVVVAFQIVFCIEININDFFYF
jgi:hypothetical protein